MRFSIGANGKNVLSGLAIPCLLLFSAPPDRVTAQDLDKIDKALSIIADYADRTCDRPLEATTEGLKLTGEAEAKLNGVVKKIADLGFKGGVEYINETRKIGALQADVIEALKTSTDCKLHIFDTLNERLLSSIQLQQHNFASFNDRCGTDHEWVKVLDCQDRICKFKQSGGRLEPDSYTEITIQIDNVADVSWAPGDAEVDVSCSVGNCIDYLRYGLTTPDYKQYSLRRLSTYGASFLYFLDGCAEEAADLLNSFRTAHN